MKHSFLFVVALIILSGCSILRPSQEELQATISAGIAQTQTAAPTMTATIVPTNTPKPTTAFTPTKTITVTPTATQEDMRVKTALVSQYHIIELTYDTLDWEANLGQGPIGVVDHPEFFVLNSTDFDDCEINDLYGHGVDPVNFYMKDYYETFANIKLHFEMWLKRDTNEPSWTVVKWGPEERYILEIRSYDSGWACFNNAQEVLWLSAERGFMK